MPKAVTKIATVAWRDFRLTVLRPAFLIGIIAIPVLGIAVMIAGIALALSTKEPPLVGKVAVIASDELIAAAELEFDEASLAQDRQEQLEQVAPASSMNMADNPALDAMTRGEVSIDVVAYDGDFDTLKTAVRDGDFIAGVAVPDAVLDVPDEDGDDEQMTLVVSEGRDSDHIRLIERRLGQAVVRVRAARSNLDADTVARLVKRPSTDTRRLLADGQEASEGEGIRELKQMLPMIFFFLIWMATLISGQHLLTSTIEEKSNRVMEVLLSAVSPMQLMTGKILGQGGVGLIIMSLYGSLGIAALITFALMHIVPVTTLILLAVYFLMAYFMIAAIMAAVGSAVSDIREANTLVTPVMMVLMLLWFLWFPISRDPNGAVALVFSFVPPAIPFAMALRLAAEEPIPVWQIGATLVWGSVCVWAMVWMCSRIFRIGVLMYGKPPSPLTLLKWLRYD
jgi:ABC-2 type transport system permease protein